VGTIPASENVFPIVRLAEVAAPSTPPSGEAHLYAKSSGLLFWKDDAGTEYPLSQAADLAAHLADTSDAHDASAISFSPTGTIAATDVQAAIAEAASEAAAGGIAVSLADNAGDMVVASANDTWAKLAKGAAGGMLSQYNGAVAWNSGTGFPASPATGNRYWRSDLGMEFYYDGTRWLSTQLGQIFITTGDGILPFSATGGGQRAGVPSHPGTDIWLVSYSTWFFVSGGTALSGSHKWVGIVTSQPAATTLVTVNIDSGASSTYRVATGSIGALLGSTNFTFSLGWTKTGTPGTLFTTTNIAFRYVTT